MRNAAAKRTVDAHFRNIEPSEFSMTVWARYPLAVIIISPFCRRADQGIRATAAISRSLNVNLGDFHHSDLFFLPVTSANASSSLTISLLVIHFTRLKAMNRD
jgi:hypothetical protein